MTDTWIRGSIGQTDQHFVTRQGTESVLASALHIVVGIRLLDLLPLLEADQAVFI
jgi:hypothetical protein